MVNVALAIFGVAYVGLLLSFRRATATCWAGQPADSWRWRP